MKLRRALPLLLLLSACKTPPAPDEVVRRYAAAASQGKVDEAWPMLSAKDRAYKSKGKLLEEAKQLEDPNVRAMLAKTRFETGAVAITGDRATVLQKTTAPDVEAIVTRAQSDPANVEKVKSLPPDQAKAFGQKLLGEALAAPDCPMKTSTETITLVREDGAWHVVADFEGHDRDERRRAIEQDAVLRDLAGKPPGE